MPLADAGPLQSSLSRWLGSGAHKPLLVGCRRNPRSPRDGHAIPRGGGSVLRAFVCGPRGEKWKVLVFGSAESRAVLQKMRPIQERTNSGRYFCCNPRCPSEGYAVPRGVALHSARDFVGRAAEMLVAAFGPAESRALLQSRLPVLPINDFACHRVS